MKNRRYFGLCDERGKRRRRSEEGSVEQGCKKLGCVGAGGGVTEQVDETVAEIEVIFPPCDIIWHDGKKEKVLVRGMSRRKRLIFSITRLL